MNDKTRRILNIIFACIAIISAVATFILSPLGKNFSADNKETTSADTTVAQTKITTEPSTAAQSQAESEFTLPEPTEATTNPYKNYTLFINPIEYTITEEKGVTTAVAKGNSSVLMTVTPLPDKTYDQHCNDLSLAHGSMGEAQALQIASNNRGFRSQTGDMDNDIITTAYCVDDGKGGCIEIKYQTPVNAQGYSEDFEIFLTMFKLL